MSVNHDIFTGKHASARSGKTQVPARRRCQCSSGSGVSQRSLSSDGGGDGGGTVRYWVGALPHGPWHGTGRPFLVHLCGCSFRQALA
jgi:hypothetical protein